MPRYGLGVRSALIVCALAAGAAPRPASAEQESWDAVYMGRTKVGHVHVKVEPVKDNQGRDLVRVRVDWELTLNRGKDRAVMRLAYGTIEKPGGEVLRLDTITRASQETIRTFGDVVDGKMTLTIESGGQKQQKAIDWAPDVRGPYGAELSLAREKIKPGETRDVKTYIPELNQVCLTRLEARQKEPVQIGRETRELLRVEQAAMDMQQKPLAGMKSTLWVDEGGQILKSKTDLFGEMLTYRTTKEGALAPDGGFDILERSIIAVRQPISDPEARREITYRVALKGDVAAEVLPADRRQSLKKGRAPDSATLVVRTAGPDDGQAGSEAVGEEFLKPNALIDCEDSRVVETMRKAVGNADTPFARAAAIVHWVHENVRDKNFSTAFAPAGEVARDLSGDCTEHSVLTAALCRAAGVPARCVVGLVYVPPRAGAKGGFGFHMWNEVYVNRRWVAVDSAFDQSSVDPTHIKLAETSLAGVAPFEALLPVVRVMDKLTIEPLEVR